MPSPFPGMDPYLEDPALWPAFHQSLVGFLHLILIPGLAQRYVCAIEQRGYRTAEGQAEERYLAVRHKPDARLVTLIDVVSPTNKTTMAGRAAYLETRKSGKAAGSNLLQIDLVLQGKPMLEYSRDGLPEWDYAVTGTRSTQPERYEIYTATLRKLLPRFRVPLAADDRDTVLDLQAAFARAYDQGDFAKRIDYRREPPGGVKDRDRRWLGTLLGWPVAATLTHGEIARTAYVIWQEQGCPTGKEHEHWALAIERLTQTSNA